MARRFLAALALAPGAAALLDGPFVDVLVNVDVRIPENIVKQAMGADVDLLDYAACQAVDDRFYDCYESGLFEPTAAASDVRNCICCAGTVAVAESYTTCSSIIMASVDGPEATSGAKSISIIGAQCKNVDASSCARNTQVQPRPTTTTTKSPTTDRNPVPTACSSMMTIYNSCSMQMDFETARARDAASCLCYDRSNEWNTVFQDYARTCASFARTAITEDYAVMTRLATICEDYPASATNPVLHFSTIGTRTHAAIDKISKPSSTASTAAPTGESTGDDGQAAEASTSSGFAAPMAVPGFLAWVANWATFLLSFYVLM